MTKAETIRAALRLDPMDHLRFGTGISGQGWYLRRFGQSERYLGASYAALRDWLEHLEQQRAQDEREYQRR